MNAEDMTEDDLVKLQEEIWTSGGEPQTLLISVSHYVAVLKAKGLSDAECVQAVLALPSEDGDAALSRADAEDIVRRTKLSQYLISGSGRSQWEKNVDSVADLIAQRGAREERGDDDAK